MHERIDLLLAQLRMKRAQLGDRSPMAHNDNPAALLGDPYQLRKPIFALCNADSHLDNPSQKMAGLEEIPKTRAAL
jgi:hypothetical protein